MTRAAEVFDATLAELGIKDSDLESERFGRRAALLVASDLLWEREIGRLLSAAEVGELLSCSKQAVSERVQRGTLLALPTAGGYGFPHWQFGGDGRPLRGIAHAVKALRDAVETPWTTAAWLVSSQPELDGTPVERLRGGDVEPVRTAAARYATRLRA